MGTICADMRPDNTVLELRGALDGAYCAVCGQRAREPRRPVIGLVQDVLVDTLAIDGKLARTIGLLIVAPAKLGRAYIDGKRVRHTPPFRLYLFASVFFFLTAAWLVTPDTEPETVGIDTGEAVVIAPDGLEDLPAGLEPLLDPSRAPQESERQDWSDIDYSGPAWLEPHIERIFEAGQRLLDDPRLFFAQSRTLLPRFLLLAPVLYGLILSLLYVYRRQYLMYDHFVVSLYMHASLYVYLLIAIAVSHVPGLGGLAWLSVLWGMAQSYLVFRQAYGSGWVSVFLKAPFSLLVYCWACWSSSVSA